jgi:microcystin-dependent protein
MSQPYVGEIRMFAGNFAPVGWMFCEGQLLAISDYDTLFNLIGTTYGGDGQSTFALPDLRGRVPIGANTNTTQTATINLAETGGVETVTLSAQQLPAHTHPFIVSTDAGSQPAPAGNVLATSATVAMYKFATPTTAMTEHTGQAGGSKPHDNFQPYLCVSFIISLFGVFPSPT